MRAARPGTARLLGCLGALACGLGGCVGDAWRGFRPEPTTQVVVQTPAYQAATLGNGLSLYVYEGSRELPLVSVVLALRAGAAAAGPGEAGLPQLTYELLVDGTERRDPAALAEAFDAIGASPRLRVLPDGALLSVQVLAPHLEEAIALFAEMLQRPRFAAEDLLERKAAYLEELKGRSASAAALGRRVLEQLLYGPEHPYGRMNGETREDLSALRREDVLRFYRRHVGPKNVALVLTGSVTLAAARAAAERHLGSWLAEVETAPPGAPAPVPVEARRQVLVVPRPGLVQTQILLGRVTVPAGHPDEYALQIACALYGDRLSWELRQEQGFTYGTSSGLQLLRGTGYFAASTAVQADATAAAVREAFYQLEELRAGPLGSREVYSSRAAAVWNMMARFRSVEGLALAAARLYFHAQPLDAYHRFVERIQAVDRAQVEDVLRRYFAPETMQLVLVGDPELIRRQVAPLRLGPIVFRAPESGPL